MTTLSSFQVTDDVTDNTAALHNRLLGMGFRAEFANTESISGTKELADGDTQYQIITASGASRTVELPPEASTNHLHVIINAGGSNNVLVKDDSGGTTFITLLPGDWCVCVPFLGLTWKVILTMSGTYTPTLTNTTNVAASAVTGPFTYARNGDIVTVAGNITIDPTLAAPTATELGISLPIASNFAAATDASGSGTAQATNTVGSITANSTDDRVVITFQATNTANTSWRVMFMYQVI